jgi:hypothetical protein
MKTSLTLLAAVVGALTLASGAASAAVSTASMDRVSQVARWVDGSEYEQAMKFTSTRSAADVRAEAVTATRGTGYVDGSEYELAHVMFMSRKTREQVRAEAPASTSTLAALTLNGGF